jgi:septum formation protein
MLVLASASPRRRQLLTQAGFRFDVAPADIPEVRAEDEGPIGFATRLARQKAASVFVERSSTHARGDQPLLVLGADTIVVVDDCVLGKPVSAADAARMLRLLSGRTHSVITGVSLVGDGIEDIAAAVTYVSFQTLSTAEIDAYVATGEPLDKAGAYAVQGYAARWIPHIQGCYFNVVGLPISLVATMMEGAQVRLAASS